MCYSFKQRPVVLSSQWAETAEYHPCLLSQASLRPDRQASPQHENNDAPGFSLRHREVTWLRRRLRAAQARVQSVAQRIAKEVKGKNCDADGHARENGGPGSQFHKLTARAAEVGPPGWCGRWRAR